MTDLHGKLAESLQRHAASVSAGPGLAQAAHQQALRLRLRRRITAGVACLVALAIAVPVGYTVLGGATKTDLAPIQTPSVTTRPRPSETEALVVTPSNEPQPSRPSETERSKTEKQEPVRITIDLGALPRGEVPRVPWYTEGVLHDGDQEFPVIDLAEGAGVTIVPVADGYLVQDDCCEGSTIVDSRARLKNADGKVIKTLHAGSFTGNVIVSADGRRLAWAEASPDENDPTTTLVVAGVRTGEELDRVRLDQRDASPVAFLGGTVVWDADTVDGGVTGLWDPDSGEVSTIEGIGRTQDVHEQVLLAAVTPDPESPCVGLVDHARGDRELWTSCDHSLGAISADGRYVFGASPRTSVEVFDATDGDVLLEVTPEVTITNWAVEPGGGLLFHVGDNGQEALVRCTLDGRCERATDIVRTGNGSTVLALPRHW